MARKHLWFIRFFSEKVLTIDLFPGISSKFSKMILLLKYANSCSLLDLVTVLATCVPKTVTSWLRRVSETGLTINFKKVYKMIYKSYNRGQNI